MSDSHGNGTVAAGRVERSCHHDEGAEANVELIDLIPNSMTFRVVTTIDVDHLDKVPADFTGRVRHFDQGRAVFVAWYQDGLLHNPGRTHPAYRQFRPDGKVKFDMYYTHGLLHDPSAKLPAVRGFYANGAVHYEERYFGGKRSDGRDGTPAIRKWRLDGTLRHELHYREGKRVPDSSGA